MFLVTCYKVDCPTPHFYVDPKGGKIPLVGALAPPQLLTNLPAADIAKIMSVNQQRLLNEPKIKFTAEEIKIIKEWYQQMQEQIAQNNTGITIVEEKKEIIDYLVVQCESNHKNYIPIVKKEEEAQGSNISK